MLRRMNGKESSYKTILTVCRSTRTMVVSISVGVAPDVVHK